MKNLIVTLLSDQPIPNVQFIKEKQNKESIFLFVSTEKMEKKGVRTWIQNVCHIKEETTITKIIDQFSSSDIEKKLNEINYDIFEKIVVNVTGGTKIMSHFVTDFFKEKPDAEVYYLTGSGNIMLQVFPKTKQSPKTMSCDLTLKEYVESHGFEMKENNLSGIDSTYTQGFLQVYLDFSNTERAIINKLREFRKPNKTLKVNIIDGLLDVLCKIEFPTYNEYLSLSKYDIRYLTGDWFEEYMYHHIKKELNLSDDYIKTGITLTKEGTPNEFDVVFLWKGNLNTIECKTSIINKIVDEMNIMNDTIYKATALQKNLGLYSKFSIFTLSSKENNELKEAHFKRGELFNIDVFGREDIVNCQKITDLLKIQSC